MYAYRLFTPNRMALAVAAALALSAGLAQAQQADDGLRQVVVTATGFEQEVIDAPASITVIGQDELKKRPFRDLTDALKDVEGVTVTGTASEKDIFIRGLPGAYTLILVDGKRQSTRDARTNGNSGFEQSFIPPLAAIERIEVVRGPMSSLYGSDAMGGVINIITKKVARQWGGSVSVDTTLQQHADSGDAYQGQFYVNGPIASDVLGLQMWGKVYKRQEDRILNGNTKALDTDFTARLALTPNKDHDILAEIGTTQVRRDASSYHTLAATRTTADTYNENPRDHMSLSHTGRYGWATSDVSISYEKAQRKSYTESPVGSDSYTQAARAPKIENLVMDGKLSLPLGAHWLVLGGQWNEATLTDVNPGVSSTLVQQFKITQKALFVEDEWKLTERLALTGGLRLDNHQVYGNHWSPRLYAVWHGTEQLVLKGGVSRGFRAPEIRTIAPGYAYTTGGAGCTVGPTGTCGVIIGDPNLKPETSTSWEMGAQWDNHAGLAAGATLFYTDFKDKVSNALVYNADGSIARWSANSNYRLWTSYNVDRATIKGIELSGRWQATRSVAFKSNYTYTDSRQKGGAYDGYALARTPKHMFNLRADWTPADAWTVWSALAYHGKEVNAAARVGTAGTTISSSGVKEYQGYTLADLGVTHDINKLTSVSAAIYNLTDKRLDEQSFNTVGDGRRLWVSLTQRF
ncbi:MULTISPECIES: TonB-dependent receptor domain-containing protein [Herbaspirillum]|uniref:Outer membrane receptor for ferrienterochelin and colicins n=1 Tax=Herbaspirillum frisingense TaxID=92645 RepID=A0ABU1PL04_9BURK|nr:MULTISPECIES: TonB-dependent receptor [Herbaspirillum]MDR6586470.1 outer membrane receptor for ferrienterochelin and colicins [Herbaspirillum frisingense]